MLRGPKREQSEDRQSRQRREGGNFFIEPGERGNDEVNQENKTEQQDGSFRERRVTEEKQREGERDGGQTEVAGQEPPVRLIPAPGQPVGGEVKHIETKEYSER